MGEISVLNSFIFNRIAAGEVVENPRSVIKELVENSIDAGADTITVEIKSGGIAYIKVTDNGNGILRDDVLTAFLPHATSKIKNMEDLNSIGTLGFRGEALPSIASVSTVTMVSRKKNEEIGYKIILKNGEVLDKGDAGCLVGTSVVVENIFESIPARAKFLRKPSSEEGDISDLIGKLILSNPKISLKYVVDGKIVYHSDGKDLFTAIYAVYGGKIIDELMPISLSMRGITLDGYVNKPGFSKHNRNFQTLIVNGRYVINSELSFCIQQCYQDFLMKRQFPMYVLHLTIPLDMVDVNVHPSKMDIKIVNFAMYKGLIYKELKQLLNLNTSFPQEVLLNTPFVESILIDDDNSSLLPDYLKKSDTTVENSSKTKNRQDFIIENFDSIQEIAVSKMKNIENSVSQSNMLSETKNNTKFTTEKSSEKLIKLYSENGKASIIPYMEFFKDFGFNKSSKVSEGGRVSRIMDGLREKETLQQVNSSQENIQIKIQEKILLSELEEENISKIENKNSKSNVDFYTSLNNFIVVGKLFNTYILIQCDNDLFVIDQHAAHEKLLYDKLVTEVDSKKVIIQDLMLPYIFEVTHSEKEKIDNIISLLGEVGFIISPLSGLNFSISGVPLLCSDLSIKDFIDTILESVDSRGKQKSSDILKEKLMQSACKAAVKGEMNLTKNEIIFLINKMKNDNSPLFCPHGRPTVVKITRNEIEKWFKRIV